MDADEFKAAIARLYRSQERAEADLGVDQSTISKYTTGKRGIPAWVARDVRRRLAQVEAEQLRARPGRRPKCPGPPVIGREPSVMELVDHVLECPPCLARLHCVLDH